MKIKIFIIPAVFCMFAAQAANAQQKISASDKKELTTTTNLDAALKTDTKDYTETSSGLSIDMVYLAGVTFTMGSPAAEVGRRREETQHSVTLSDFYIGKYEVTQKQWKVIMGSSPSRSNIDCDNCPVESISWEDIQHFLKKLNRQTGKTYTLPTEAQWEYACRAGTTTVFNTGSNLTTDQANYDGNYPYNGNPIGGHLGKTKQVGSFEPNEYGLYDMHGNVWEWCSDWYEKDYYQSSPQSNPNGPDKGSFRVIRGGSSYDQAQYCRTASRFQTAPDSREFNFGFRLASPK